MYTHIYIDRCVHTYTPTYVRVIGVGPSMSDISVSRFPRFE